MAREEKKSDAVAKTFDRRGMETVSVPLWAGGRADFFRQCRAINRANTRTHVRARETRGEPSVALLKVEPETEFTFAASLGSHARRPLFVNRVVSRSRNSNERPDVAWPRRGLRAF